MGKQINYLTKIYKNDDSDLIYVHTDTEFGRYVVKSGNHALTFFLSSSFRFSLFLSSFTEAMNSFQLANADLTTRLKSDRAAIRKVTLPAYRVHIKTYLKLINHATFELIL